MMIRRFTSICASAVGIVGLMLATAGQAHALTINTVDCSVAVGAPTNVSVAPGDTILITATLTGCNQVDVDKTLVASNTSADITFTYSGTVAPSRNAGPTSYTLFIPPISGAGSFTSVQILVKADATAGSLAVKNGGNGSEYQVSIGSGGNDSDSTPAGGVPPVIQQFGLPSVGSCDDSASTELNWAGVPSGGWGTSWAQWMNDGAGGAVCTRTLAYVGNAWTVS